MNFDSTSIIILNYNKPVLVKPNSMSKTDDNPQLDERIWQAWIQKNSAQDQVRFRRRVKVIGLVSLCLALSAMLFEIHKETADVFQLRPMPGFRSKTVLGGSSVARMVVEYRS